MSPLTIKKIKVDSKPQQKAIMEAFQSERFLMGSTTSQRLKRSLAVCGRLDLVDRTLLSASVQATHAEKLSKRYQDRFIKFSKAKNASWMKLPKALKSNLAKPTDESLADNHFRFLTLLDCVVELDAHSAIKEVKRLKSALASFVKSCAGIWCLGVIEVEVVSLEKMRAIYAANESDQSERRKFEVCEALSLDMASTLFGSAKSVFLVHFHGVITAKKSSQFDIFESSLKACEKWKRTGRQVQLKRLSKEFGGKRKPYLKSLEDIAKYITKGGNDWNAGRNYLQYKFGFEGEDEESWIRKNLHRNQLLKKEHMEDGFEDPISLTIQETCELAVLIDLMMGLDRTRTGYLISAGSR